MEASYTPWAAVSAIVVGVIILRVFFTLWTRADRKMTGDPLGVSKDIEISGLKEACVHVHFRSGTELRDVVLVGYCSTHHAAPYDFRQLLILCDEGGKNYYARIGEIEYFEQAD